MQRDDQSATPPPQKLQAQEELNVNEMGREVRARLVDGLPEILAVLDSEGTITFAYGSLVSHVKMSAADLMGKSAWEFVHPDDLGDALSSLAYAQTAEGRPVGPFLFRYFDRDGKVRTADAVAVNRSDDPAVRGTVMLLRDVVGERAVERALECLAEGEELAVIASHLLRAVEEMPITGPGWLLRSAQASAAGVDAGHLRPEVVALSPGAAPLGELAALVGDWVFDPAAETPVVDPDLSTVSDALRSALHALGIRSLMAMPVRTPGATRPDLWLVAGNRRQAPATANELRTIRRYASVLSVAFERLRLQADLRHAAVHDGLTGLPNRAAFMARLAEAREGSYALLFLDLNGFKPINDRLGHSAGDAVLVEIGRRIAGCVHADDLLARLGGDEFAVLLHESAPERAATLAEAIVQSVARPLEVAHENVSLGVSIGIATGSAHELEGLLEHADSAMYQARPKAARAHGGSQCMASAASQTVDHPVDVELVQRLNRRECSGSLFPIYYKPKTKRKVPSRKALHLF
ncbi:MAG TPA: GGDEF domain-containing protein [Pyrinomonadaceae bacterium]|jgi:diguanylate cyclase (GGDEF)-like protein/PAS domain S-box-containing protein